MARPGSAAVARPAHLGRELEPRATLPYARHVTDQIVALDTGALMVSFRLDGASFETADVRDLNDWHGKLNGAWRNLASDRPAVWHHLVRRRDDAYPTGAFRSDFARDLDAAYRRRIEKEENLDPLHLADGHGHLDARLCELPDRK